MLKDKRIKRKLILIFIGLLMLFTIIIFGKTKDPSLNLNVNQPTPMRGQIIEVSFDLDTDNIRKIEGDLNYDTSALSFVTVDEYNPSINLEFDHHSRRLDITYTNEIDATKTQEYFNIKFEVLENTSASETMINFDNIILETTKFKRINHENLSLSINLSN